MDSPSIINWVSPPSFLGVLGLISIFVSIFFMKFLGANRIAPDGTPHSGAILFAYVPQKGRQAYMSYAEIQSFYDLKKKFKLYLFYFNHTESSWNLYMHS